MTSAIKLQACRGMKDFIGAEAQWLRQVEEKIFEIAKKYGYQLIQTPTLESRELFVRAVGNQTDVVQKEMFSIQGDQEDASALTLRPEGTASCVRAGIEHSLLRHQVQRWAYCGPMFRRERPQKGRYRQFHQFGLELFGLKTLASSLEILLLIARVFKAFGVDHALTLELNTLGTLSERKRYKERLQEFFQCHWAALDPGSQERALLNPLRLLDSKNESLHEILQQAPKLWDSLEANSQEEFSHLCHQLKQLNLPFRINEQLVRGLDYYNGLVFEWTTDRLGTQGTVCGGGRYDDLVEWMQGPPTPAVGCAFGMERLILLLKELGSWQVRYPKVQVAIVTPDLSQESRALGVAEKIRTQFSDWNVLQFYGKSLRKQLEMAENARCEWALIVQWASKDSEEPDVDLKYLKDRTIKMSGDLISSLRYLEKEYRS